MSVGSSDPRLRIIPAAIHRVLDRRFFRQCRLEVASGCFFVTGDARSGKTANAQGCVHSQQLNDGIRELTAKITLDDILNAYRQHNADLGIGDYCI